MGVGGEVLHTNAGGSSCFVLSQSVDEECDRMYNSTPSFLGSVWALSPVGQPPTRAEQAANKLLQHGHHREHGLGSGGWLVKDHSETVKKN